MLLDLSDILKKDLDPFEAEISSKDLDVRIPEELGIVSAIEDFSLFFSKKEGGLLFLEGDTDVDLRIPCGRCLAEVKRSQRIHMEYVLSVVDEEIHQDEEDPLGALSGNILDIDALLCEEILVSIPSKVLCRSDCKGICPNCGKNLNEGSCGCDTFARDPRMQKFIDVFSEFKEV